MIGNKDIKQNNLCSDRLFGWTFKMFYDLMRKEDAICLCQSLVMNLGIGPTLIP